MRRVSGTRFIGLLALMVVAVLAVMLGTTAAPAQEAGFRLTVKPGANDYPIALPTPLALAGADSSTAEELLSVLRRDLEMTGYFKIIDPNAYLDQSEGIEPGTFPFEPWRKIRAVALAKTRIRVREDGLAADVFVYDVGAGDKVSAKRFIGRQSDVRYLGHKIADEILLALTGEHGFFGNRIAAVGSRSGNKEIYVMDMDGNGVHSVTRNGSINLSPAWSPDGRHIAWTSFKRGNPDLFAKELASGRTRVLSNRPGINTGAAYSPDGRRIALARSTGGDSDVYVIDAFTGQEVSRVTRGGGIDVAPNYSPDGAEIAFSSERSGGSQVFVADLSTGQARRITFAGDFNFDPVYSPDGDKIAFVGRSEGFNVFVVDRDGKNMIPITQDQGNNEDPSWSPDGRYLVFGSDRRGRQEVWVSTADGRHQTPVTDGHGGWTQPTWSPVK
jgi:TolB protein